MSKRGWILFAALGILWGIPYLLIRVAVADLDPVVVAGARTVLGAVVLLPVAVFGRQLGPVLRRWPLLLVYTVVEIVVPWWLLSWAETRLTSSTAGLLIAAVPLIAAVILVATGQERFGPRRITGLLIGFAGVAALVGFDIDLHDVPAVGAALLTAVGYAFGALIIGKYLSDLPQLAVVTVSLTMASIAYLPFLIWRWPTHPVPAKAIWSVVALALLCTVAAFLLLFRLVAEVGAARATVITYINPAVAIVLGILILHEPFSAGLAVGFPLVILGAIMATSRSAPPPAVADSRAGTASV